MESNKKYKRIMLYLTAYGPFGTIVLNPTDVLLQSIVKNKEFIEASFEGKIKLEHYETFKVDVEYVRNKLPEIQRQMFLNEDPNDMKLIIDFGVNASIKVPKLNLECIAYNYIDDFKEIKGKIINTDIEKLESKLCLDKIREPIKDIADLSLDAGRYLCNFAFFLNNYAVKDSEDFYAEFIHIPDFDVFTTEQGLNGFMEFLISLRDIYLE